MNNGDSKKVKLKLFGNLREKFAEHHGTTLELQEGSTVESMLNSVGIPEEKAKLIMVNGTDKDIDYTIKDGDTISIFPIVMGG